MGKLFVTVVSALTMAGGLSAGLSVAGTSGDASVSKKTAKEFVPAEFRGTWSGTWNNLTFDTTGDASTGLKVKSPKKKPVMFGIFKLGGGAFGCESIAPRPVRMKKGKGSNQWNDGGFKAQFNNGEGLVRINYNHRKSRISGSGISPCTAAVTFTFTGTLNSRSVMANTEIFINGAPFAESKLEMKR